MEIRLVLSGAADQGAADQCACLWEVLYMCSSNEYSRFDAKFARDIDLRRKHYCPDSTVRTAGAGTPTPDRTAPRPQRCVIKVTDRRTHGSRDTRRTIGHDTWTCADPTPTSGAAGTAGGADRGRSGPRDRTQIMCVIMIVDSCVIVTVWTERGRSEIVR